MNRFLLSVGVALLIGGHAQAADLYAKAAPAPLGYDWSGVYVGGHIGGGWESTTFTDPSEASVLTNCCLLISTTNNPSAPTKATASSFIGGAQVGAMYQIGKLVVGADFDWSGTSMNGSGSTSMTAITAGGPFANEAYSVKTQWTATSTTVIGMARDRLLIYGKAGVAWAHNSYGVGISGVGGTFGGPGGTPFAFGATSTDTVTGWTVGTGVKWALYDNWFLNAEYNYLDFGSKVENLSGAFTASPAAFLAANPGATVSPTFNHNISEVKVGLNYKFPSGFLFF